MLPVISASSGNIIVCFFGWFGDLTLKSPKFSVRVLRAVVMLRNQHCENRRQKHKDKRLDNADENLHEIKWNRKNRREVRVHRRHRLQNAFTGIDVPKESKAQRN